MGYYSRFSGEIRIEPPLVGEELAVETGRAGDYDVAIRTTQEQIHRGDGTYARARGVAVIPFADDEMKGYQFKEHLEALIARHHPEHRFDGTILREGRQPGDISRFVVENNVVREEEARVVWPDGTEYRKR